MTLGLPVLFVVVLLLECLTVVFSDTKQCECPKGVNCAEVSKRCRCLIKCKLLNLTGPVCSEKGRTYNNLCELRLDECEKNYKIFVKHYGRCSRPCADAKRESRTGQCRQWRRHRACLLQPSLMMQYCRFSCGFCKSSFPRPQPLCKSSEYGCCYQSTKAAEGPNGEGCPIKCQDRSWCKYFVSACGMKINRKTMKKYCPVVCHYCDPNGNKKRKNRNNSS